MTEGSIALYQGIPCLSVRFSRSRGVTPDAAIVDIPVTAFATVPTNFDLEHLAPGDLIKIKEPFPTEDFVLKAISGGPSNFDFTYLGDPHLKPYGSLILAEVVDGEQWVLTLHPLFVRHVTEIKRADGISVVRLTLNDIRMFGHRGIVSDSTAPGLVPRWSFNRLQADGTPSPDSVRADGKPFTLEEILSRFVVPNLAGKLELARVPAEFSTSTLAVDFDPFSTPAAALEQIARDHKDLEDPVLTLDNKIELWTRGQGREPGDEGAQTGLLYSGRGDDAKAVPEKYVLYREGTGRAQEIQPGFPEDFVVVRGGQTVATVQVDDWDPILLVEGEPVPLDERTVRVLTDNKYGIDWLKEWVLADKANQGAVDVSDKTIEILKDAWRLYRLPFVEKRSRAGLDVDALAQDQLPESNLPDRTELYPGTDFSPSRHFSGPNLEFVPEGVISPEPLPKPEGITPDQEDVQRERAQFLLKRQQILEGESISPGATAHLLPMLPRAELQGKRRMPITIETYSFGMRRAPVTQDTANKKFAAVREELSKFKTEVLAVTLREYDPDLANRIRVGRDEGVLVDGNTDVSLARGLTQTVIAIDRLQAGGGFVEDPAVIEAQGPALNIDLVDARILSRFGFSTSQLRSYVRIARNIEQIARVRAELGELWASIMDRYYQAAEDLGAVGVRTLWEVAKRFVEFEKEVRANEASGFTKLLGNVADVASDFVNWAEHVWQGTELGPPASSTSSIRTINEAAKDPRNLPLRYALEIRLKDLYTELEQKAKEAERLAKAGIPSIRLTEASTTDNMVRKEDAGARVVDADAGIIRLSKLPGWVKAGLPDIRDAGPFQPKPVRVTFGSTVRPRIDLPYGKLEPIPQPRPQTGLGANEEPLRNYAPAVRTDAETWYVSMWGRDGNKVDLRFGTSQSVYVIQRPDLVQLVPLLEEGNLATLDREARDAALKVMRVPQEVTAEKVVLGRPWAVNCDGVVRKVEINMRPEGGFETVVYVGKSDLPDENPYRTRTRGNLSRRPTWGTIRLDSTEREGLG